MAGDVWSVLWKDARSYRAQFSEPRRLVLSLIGSALFLFFVEFAIGIHEQLRAAHPVLLIWVWCWLPLGSAVTLSTDAIAGERERHTLETLLATRIPVRAFLLGKTLSITIQSWLSASLLAFGALFVLNAATVWRGELVLYPWSVLVFGPIFSFLLTMLGTLAAILFSMDAPTVRQANFRIVIVTSILPVLMLVPLLFMLFFAVLGAGFVAQLTGYSYDIDALSVNSGLIALVVVTAIFGLGVSVGFTYLITAYRFTRERLLRAGASGGTRPAEAQDPPPTRHAAPALGFEQAYPAAGTGVDDHGLQPEAAWLTIFRDARIVAWKELTEARGLVREWRGWLFVVVFVLLSMVVQLSALGSWYWSQDADTSILFWMAMLAGMPILIAQRSADAIAGERERHTGEILFTTRLSHTGIILGKLGVTALLPWLLMLSVPVIGLIATNLFYSGEGPHFYPPDVLIAGVGVTLGVAMLFASAGMLVSLGAPTVQHAARRISWFLMPLLIAPGLAMRGSVFSADIDQVANLDESNVFSIAGSGDLALFALAAVPLLAFASGTLIYFLVTRFQRGNTVFD